MVEGAPADPLVVEGAPADPPSTPDPPVPFRVLVVCTANQCRSPLGENLLRQAVMDRGLDWTVASAGTRAVDGLQMDPHAEAVLLERGAAPATWASHALTVSCITAADLILTADVEHRQAVTRLVPAAGRRVFTLLQFARFVRQLPAGAPPPRSGAELVSRAAAVRTQLQPPGAGEDDLADPIGRSIRSFRTCADTITTALAQILRPITGG